MYDDCTCCACLQDSHLETLRYELQGLLDAAVRIGDMEIVKLLAPDASERESWARPIVTVDQVPAELLGLAAARGHLTLVERLLQLSSDPQRPHRRPPLPWARADVSAARTEEAGEAALCARLDAMLENAILEGDVAMKEAIMPDYARALHEAHLSAELSALPRVVALLAQRRQQDALSDLAAAGATAWARTQREFDTLDQLVAGDQLGALRQDTCRRSDAPDGDAWAVLRASASSPLGSSDAERGAATMRAHRQDEALVLAAASDSQTFQALLNGTLCAADVGRVVGNGDVELLAALVDTQSPVEPNDLQPWRSSTASKAFSGSALELSDTLESMSQTVLGLCHDDPELLRKLAESTQKSGCAVSKPAPSRPSERDASSLRRGMSACQPSSRHAPAAAPAPSPTPASTAAAAQAPEASASLARAQPSRAPSKVSIGADARSGGGDGARDPGAPVTFAGWQLNHSRSASVSAEAKRDDDELAPTLSPRKFSLLHAERSAFRGAYGVGQSALIAKAGSNIAEDNKVWSRLFETSNELLGERARRPQSTAAVRSARFSGRAEVGHLGSKPTMTLERRQHQPVDLYSMQPSRSDFDERIDHEAQRVWQPHSHSPFRANAQRSPLRMHADDAARTQTRRSQPNFAPNTHVHSNDGRKAACQAHHQSLCGFY